MQTEQNPQDDQGGAVAGAGPGLGAGPEPPVPGPAGAPAVPHPSLAPLLFLLGRWEGAGVVGYPTIESARFGQEISFSHNGKPFLIYQSRTWLLDEAGNLGRPLAMETGFWRPQEDGRLEVVSRIRPGSSRSTSAK